jgi:hypothetical protein
VEPLRASIGVQLLDAVLSLLFGEPTQLAQVVYDLPVLFAVVLSYYPVLDLLIHHVECLRVNKLHLELGEDGTVARVAA